VRFILRLIGLLAIVALAVFAVSNRAPLTLDLWPLPAVVLPTYLAILVALLIGYLLGGSASWATAGKWRRRAREATRRATALEADLAAEEDEAPR